MTKVPFGGAGTGANPTDCGKKGTKRSILTDGKGILLSVAVDITPGGNFETKFVYAVKGNPAELTLTNNGPIEAL